MADFLGAPATAQPVTGVPAVPGHPWLAANGDSGIHGDGWMSDTYTRPGPLGNDTRVDSLLLGSECGSIAFDHAGRIISNCPGLNPGLYLIDPAGLKVLGHYPLSGRGAGEFLKPGAFSNFGGGSDLTDPWYWTTLDFRSGNLVWQRRSGSGPLYNNNYAGIALGPDGTAYLGVLGGLISLRDGR